MDYPSACRPSSNYFFFSARADVDHISNSSFRKENFVLQEELLTSGDIELNPGPLQSSFSPITISRTKCACNPDVCLSFHPFVIHSLFRGTGLWTAISGESYFVIQGFRNWEATKAGGKTFY